MLFERFRILVTGAGTTTAVSVLKGLRLTGDPSLHVIMGDMSRDCAGAHLGDEFIELPSASQPDFGDRIVPLCIERRIDLVIPIIDHEFVGWSRVRNLLRDHGTQVAISSAAALKKCQEKDATYALFQKLSIPTIPSWRAARDRRCKYIAVSCPFEASLRTGEFG